MGSGIDISIIELVIVIANCQLCVKLEGYSQS